MVIFGSPVMKYASAKRRIELSRTPKAQKVVRFVTCKCRRCRLSQSKGGVHGFSTESCSETCRVFLFLRINERYKNTTEQALSGRFFFVTTSHSASPSACPRSSPAARVTINQYYTSSNCCSMLQFPFSHLALSSVLLSLCVFFFSDAYI